MYLQRFYHDGLAQASYLLGCQATGEALVVDPNRDAESYVAAATAHGLRITAVTETHIHADFVSGTRELCALTGARALLSAECDPTMAYAFADRDNARLLRDRDIFMIGNIGVEVVHTPGHTPEHLTFVVTDTPASDRPLGAFTGDFIFAGDVGRPDLLERAVQRSGTMHAAAGQLFDALARFAARFPDFLQLWPGHGAGSACGKALGAVPQSTLGYEKIANWAFQLRDRAAFVAAVLEGQPDPPRYFAQMKRVNAAGPDIVGGRPPLRRAATTDLPRALRESTVVDLRPTAAFLRAHIPGSLNLPMTALLQWAGWHVPYDRPIYLVGSDADGHLATRAARELSLIGLDQVAGWFGPDALDASHATGTIPQLDPGEAARWLADGDALLVDVRAEDEWADGHVADARHAPLGRLDERTPDFASAPRVIVMCQGGGRSAIGASVLAARGVRHVANLQGGFTAWRAAGLPVVTGDVVERR